VGTALAVLKFGVCGHRPDFRVIRRAQVEHSVNMRVPLSVPSDNNKNFTDIRENSENCTEKSGLVKFTKK